jgi:hypothetical protein
MAGAVGIPLVVAAKRLRPYFQAQTIRVLTDYPLKQILHKPKTSGCLVKWVIELEEFNLKYLPRPLWKGQALADFIAKFTGVAKEEGRKMVDLWIIDVDGLANKRSWSGGQTPKRAELRYAIKIGFKTTNNEVEYEAVLAGLAITRNWERKM